MFVVVTSYPFTILFAFLARFLLASTILSLLGSYIKLIRKSNAITFCLLTVFTTIFLFCFVCVYFFFLSFFWVFQFYCCCFFVFALILFSILRFLSFLFHFPLPFQRKSIKPSILLSNSLGHLPSYQIGRIPQRCRKSPRQ